MGSRDRSRTRTPAKTNGTFHSVSVSPTRKDSRSKSRSRKKSRSKSRSRRRSRSRSDSRRRRSRSRSKVKSEDKRRRRSRSPSDKPGGNEESKVFIGNIDHMTDEVHFEERFKTYGRIVDIFIPRDIEKRCNRGFGFVTFESSKDALKACEEDGREFHGRKVGVNIARVRRNEGHKSVKTYVPSVDGDGGAMRAWLGSSFRPFGSKKAKRRQKSYSRSRSRSRRRRDSRSRSRRSRSRDRRRRRDSRSRRRSYSR